MADKSFFKERSVAEIRNLSVSQAYKQRGLVVDLRLRRMGVGMSRSKSSPKKEYLLRKMFDGAGALYDFFETMKSDRGSSPAGVAEELKRTYGLTSNQQKYLDKVVDRTSKAKVVVNYLERKFGLNEDGTFEDARGLHKFLFNDDKKRVEARSYNIGIGFTKGYWGVKNCLGYKENIFSEEPCLSSPKGKTISRLERGISGDCGSLTFHLPSKTRMKRNASDANNRRTKNEKLLHAIFGNGLSADPEKLRDQVVDHEMKHVIDAIIGDSYHQGFFVETSAHMYEGTRLEFGLRRDLKTEWDSLEHGVKMAKKSLNNLGSRPGCPEVILERTRNYLSRREAAVEKFKIAAPKQIEIFNEFKRKRISRGNYEAEKDRKVKSYLFSTMSPDKLFKRIAEVTYPNNMQIDEIDKQEPEVVIESC